MLIGEDAVQYQDLFAEWVRMTGKVRARCKANDTGGVAMLRSLALQRLAPDSAAGAGYPFLFESPDDDLP